MTDRYTKELIDLTIRNAAELPDRTNLFSADLNITPDGLRGLLEDFAADMMRLRPMATAPKGEYVLLFGPSGYTPSPLRAEVCKHDAVFRRENTTYRAWVNHAGDAFSDGGSGPIGWLPLPPS